MDETYSLDCIAALKLKKRRGLKAILESRDSANLLWARQSRRPNLTIQAHLVDNVPVYSSNTICRCN